MVLISLGRSTWLYELNGVILSSHSVDAAPPRIGIIGLICPKDESFPGLKILLADLIEQRHGAAIALVVLARCLCK